MYLARGIHRGDQDLDPDEFLIVEEIPLKELVDMVYDGTITDGKTQVGILKAAHLIESI